MKKPLYCLILILFIIFPFSFYLIYSPVDLPQNQTLRSSYDAYDYIGLGNDIDREGLTGDNITIAVLDTGIREDHAVFNTFGNWEDKITYYDYSINDTSTSPDDVGGHGTAVTSILGGNSLSYTGVAPNINILAMKIFFNDGGEIISNINVIESAINWIIKNKNKYSIRVASMSLGLEFGAEESAILYINNIVEKLTQHNILVVAAAGNSGENGYGSIEAPSSAKSVLAVGGVDYQGNMYSQSSQGPTIENVIKPDVCAPAIGIYAASSAGLFTYLNITGTSAAVPFVSGLSALMIEKQGTISALQLKNVISLTSYRTIYPRTLKDNIQGWGIIQGYAALNALDTPQIITQESSFQFTLNDTNPVYCLPIKLSDINQYFFQLNSLNTAEAEIYLFEVNPDENGNPILITDSISAFDSFDKTNRISVFNSAEKNYFLVVKLIHGTGSGLFSVTLTFDLRIMVFLLFVGINIISLAFIGFMVRNYIKVR
ncbi:MAG: S8 family serine peptidase [Candidatus Lokiarchaeota archaeon]|nr:S8 family serine peptidase [Candidatus Lokiarchaeota archaeon]